MNVNRRTFLAGLGIAPIAAYIAPAAAGPTISYYNPALIAEVDENGIARIIGCRL